jgi:hypothetical protein
VPIHENHIFIIRIAETYSLQSRMSLPFTFNIRYAKSAKGFSSNPFDCAQDTRVAGILLPAHDPIKERMPAAG